MNASLLKTVCVVSLLSVASVAWSQDAKGGAEESVAALEQQWIDSEKANNAELAAPLFADAAIFTASNGSVETKAEFLAREKLTKYASAEYADMKVTVVGDTAIVSAIFNSKGISSTGKPFNISDRTTDTWVKMPNGRWQLIANHQSAIQKQ